MLRFRHDPQRKMSKAELQEENEKLKARVEELETQVTDAQLALVEMYEAGGGE